MRPIATQARTLTPSSRAEPAPTKSHARADRTRHALASVGASSACDLQPRRPIPRTQIAGRARSYKKPCPSRSHAPRARFCRSKLCLRPAATQAHTSQPQIAGRARSYKAMREPVARATRLLLCRSKLCLRLVTMPLPCDPQLFSRRKKTSNFVGGGGSSRSKSGPLGRGPEICQHLTQQGASKGFYTLRSLRPPCSSASSTRLKIFSARCWRRHDCGARRGEPSLAAADTQCASSQLLPTPASTSSGTSS